MRIIFLLFLGLSVPAFSTALSQITASLSPGQSSTSLGDAWTGGSLPTGDNLNWINKFHYDPVRKVAFMLSKIQNNNTAMKHAWYDEDANQWVSENCGFNTAGHAYDCVGYDHVTGTGYLVPGGGRDDVLWTSSWTPGQALGRPTVATSSAVSAIAAILYSGASTFISGAGAMDWHPDLFGTGDAGMVVVCQKGVAGWRKSTDTWHIIVPSGNYAVGPNTPGCVYSRGLDAVIMSPNSDGNKLFKIDDYQTWISSADAGLNPAPIPFGPDVGGGARAALVDDPLARPTLYALEKGGGGRVWKYSSGAWTLQSFKHPFTANDNYHENWMVAALYGHGCIWALENTGNLPRSRIWRPDDITGTAVSRSSAVPAAPALSVSPNPWHGGKLTLTAVSGGGEIRITGIGGREIARFKAGAKASWNPEDGVAPGVYLVRCFVKGKMTGAVKLIAAF